MPPTRNTRSNPHNLLEPNRQPISRRKNPEPEPEPTYRKTPTHIYFHGGVLSNWHLCQTPFEGALAFPYVLPHLQKLDIAYPPDTSVSTRMLAVFPFPRGEQWMMAMKAWLFERDECLENTSLSEAQAGILMGVVLQPTLLEPEHPAMVKVVEYVSAEDVRVLWESSLVRILRERKPIKQKGLGRRVRGFEEEVWRRASVPIVTAGCVARAKGNRDLRMVYQEAEGRVFVEGSPRDRVWGVGLGWKSATIEDEANWRGENRLGRCHSLAAEIICGKEGGLV